KDAGFDTFLWSANMHLKKRGFGQGFTNKTTHYLQTKGSISIEGMIRQIKDKYHSNGKPEFHYVHTMDVHFPYLPPHPFEWQFISRATPYVRHISKTGVPLDDLGERIESSLPYYAETHDLEFDDNQHLKNLYDGSIRYTDHYLPELLETLNYDPNSDMLIITADHGEQFYLHGWWGHGRLLLPEEIHVPLIIKHPDFPPPLCFRPHKSRRPLPHPLRNLQPGKI
ncbi:MAG: sulfatase-like hydrolase/transferase, partial [Candidatus Hydrogenedentota bacterium]